MLCIDLQSSTCYTLSLDRMKAIILVFKYLFIIKVIIIIIYIMVFYCVTPLIASNMVYKLALPCKYYQYYILCIIIDYVQLLFNQSFCIIISVLVFQLNN